MQTKLQLSYKRNEILSGLRKVFVECITDKVSFMVKYIRVSLCLVFILQWFNCLQSNYPSIAPAALMFLGRIC